jgi:hypothetical protein
MRENDNKPRKLIESTERYVKGGREENGLVMSRDKGRFTVEALAGILVAR